MKFYYLPDHDLWVKIKTIVLPLSLQALLMHIDTTIDSLMLGSIDKGIASVSQAGQVQFIYNMLMASCASALSIFVAQYWGKKDTRTVEKLLGMSMQINMLLSVIFFAVTFFFPYQVMRIFVRGDEYVQLGGEYLRYVAISYFFLAASQSLGIICRCTGFAKQLLWISCATVPLDIIFNYIFIFGINGYLQWGVSGAAIATVIVRFIVLLMTWFEFRRERLFRMRFFYLINFARSLFMHVMKLTLPILGNYGCYGAGMITAAIIMGHQDSDAVDAHALARVIINASCIFYSGLSAGTSIILGNIMGSNDLHGAKKTGRKLLFFILAAGCASTILMLCAIPFVEYLSSTLTPEAAVLTKWMLVLSVPYMIGRAGNAFLFQAFNTGGDSKYSFLTDFRVVVCMVIPLGLLAAFVFHAPVLLLFFIVYMDEPFKMPIAYLHYRKFKWMKNLTLQGKKAA